MKSWLQDDNVEMYSTYNEGKCIAAEKFIRTLKNKIYKYMTSISQNVYFDKLDNILNEYNNTCHKSIKIKSIDVKSRTCFNFGAENNYKDPKFDVSDYLKISKYIDIFGKFNTPNWSEEVFVIKKVKNTVPWTEVIEDINDEEVVEHFMKKNCKKQIKQS